MSIDQEKRRKTSPSPALPEGIALHIYCSSTTLEHNQKKHQILNYSLVYL